MDLKSKASTSDAAPAAQRKSTLKPPALESKAVDPIQPGSRVRSYDFPESPHREACYVEGVVKRITEPIEGCRRYEIAVEKRIFNHAASKGPDKVYPPLNGTPSLLGGVTTGVVLLDELPKVHHNPTMSANDTFVMGGFKIIQAPDLDIDADLRRDGFENRHRMERAVVANLIAYLEFKGFTIKGVDDGEEFVPYQNAKDSMELIFDLDEAHLKVGGKGKTHAVFFVMGNDGDDVIADWNYSKDDGDGFNEAMEAFDTDAVVGSLGLKDIR